MNNKWTKLKLSDPVIKAGVKTFAFLLIALSGAILFSDKVLNFELANNFGYRSTKTFIWVLSQTLSPLILIFGALLRPYRIAYTIPVYFYSIQLIWVFNSKIKFDDALLQVYAIGCVIAFILIVISVNFLFNKAIDNKASKLDFYKQALDLSLQINAKK